MTRGRQPRRPLGPELRAFIRHLANADKSPKTIRSYEEAVGLLMGYFDEPTPGEISPDQLDEFFEVLRRRRSKATVNLYKSAVRAFFKFLTLTDKVSKDPTRLLRNAKVTRKSPPIFSKEQLARLLAAIETAIGAQPDFQTLRDWTMVVVSYNAGLRVSELVSIDIPDVEQKRVLQVIGKGNKRRDVPINSTLQAALGRYLPVRKGIRSRSGALFLNRFGTRITTRSVERSVAKWLKRAGIEAEFSPHTFRHTFGTHVLRKTRNLRTTQELLGHSSPSTTQIYTHVEDPETAAAVESLATP